MDVKVSPDWLSYLREGAQVTCYRYRGGVIVGKRVFFDRDSDHVKNLEKNLARLSGQRYEDSHTIYRVQGLNDDRPTFFWFTDYKMIVGFQVELEYYGQKIEDERLAKEAERLNDSRKMRDWLEEMAK